MSHAAHGRHARAADPRASPRLRAAGCGERGSHEALTEVPRCQSPPPSEESQGRGAGQLRGFSSAFFILL